VIFTHISNAYGAARFRTTRTPVELSQFGLHYGRYENSLIHRHDTRTGILHGQEGKTVFYADAFLATVDGGRTTFPI
jgi:hypothetical protein